MAWPIVCAHTCVGRYLHPPSPSLLSLCQPSQEDVGIVWSRHVIPLFVHESPIGWNMRSLKSVTNSPSPTESTHKIILNYILSTCWKIIDVKDDTFVATLLSCFDGTLSGDVSCCMEYNLFGEEFIKWMILCNLCSEKLFGRSYYHTYSSVVSLFVFLFN